MALISRVRFFSSLEANGKNHQRPTHMDVIEESGVPVVHKHVAVTQEEGVFLLDFFTDATVDLPSQLRTRTKTAGISLQIGVPAFVEVDAEPCAQHGVNPGLRLANAGRRECAGVQ